MYAFEPGQATRSPQELRALIHVLLEFQLAFSRLEVPKESRENEQ